MNLRSPRVGEASAGARRVAVLALAVFAAAGLGSLAQAEDVWRSGYAMPAWRQVEALQRHPVVEAIPARDLAESCRHLDRGVRAAACLAIGRGGDERHLPLVVERLEDHSPLVRRCALWALLQMHDPAVKRPLLNVLANWSGLEEWDHKWPGLTYSRHLPRLGLPKDLLTTNTPREERRQWIAEFDAAAWRIPPGGWPADPYRVPPLAFQPGVERSEIDAGETLAIILRQVSGDQEDFQYYDPSLSMYRLIAASDLAPERSHCDGNLGFGVGAIAIERKTALTDGEQAGYRLTLKTDPAKLLPGVYLMHLSDLVSPLLIRVRRSATVEATIGTLLNQVPAPGAVEQLGQLRVQAAVEPLLQAYRQSRGQGGFVISGALAEIGDPAAVPVLLDYPKLLEYDGIAYAFRDLMGMGEAAWPACKGRVLQWKELLAQQRMELLEIALRVLEEDPSATVADLRWEIVQALEEEQVDFAAAEDCQKLLVLTTALLPCARVDAKRFVEAVWAFHDRPGTFGWLIHTWRRDDARPFERSDDGWIAQELQRRILTLPPETIPEAGLLTQNLARVAPPEVSEDAPLAEAWQATLLAKAARNVRSRTDGPAIRARQERALERILAYLDRNFDPQVAIEAALTAHPMGKPDVARELLQQIGERSQDKAYVRSAHYGIAEIALEAGRVEEAKQRLRLVRETLPPEPDLWIRGLSTYESRDQLASRLQAIDSYPQVEGLEFRRRRFHASAEVDVKPEVAAGHTFTLDSLRRLSRWEIATAHKTPLAVLPNPVRAIAAVDRRRVFVAFEHGVAALYEVGRSGPVWERTLALSGEPGLSATPDAIVAASETGAIHVLAPDTGHLRWTAQAEPAPYCGYLGRRRIVRQTPDHILLIDPLGSPGRVVCFDRQAGRLHWSLPLRNGVSRAVVGADFLAAVDSQGRVVALDVNSGRLRWRRSYPVSTPGWPRISLATDEAHSMVYVASEDAVHALDAVTGRTHWTWTWRPLHEAVLEGHPSPTLAMTERGVFCVLNWSEKAPTRSDRVDVALLDASGRVLLHAASPLEPLFRSTSSPAENILAANDTLFFRRGGFWESWRWAPDHTVVQGQHNE